MFWLLPSVASDTLKNCLLFLLYNSKKWETRRILPYFARKTVRYLVYCWHQVLLHLPNEALKTLTSLIHFTLINSYCWKNVVFVSVVESYKKG